MLQSQRSGPELKLFIDDSIELRPLPQDLTTEKWLLLIADKSDA